MTTALIDGDIVAYTVAAVCQRDTRGWNDEPCDPWFNEDEVRASVTETARAWTEAAGCDQTLVLLTGQGNFRKVICPTYKSNRKSVVRPVALPFAKSCLEQAFPARTVDGLEADDLIGLYLTSPLGRDAVAVSTDKDMRTLPGIHLNPAKDRWPVTVTEREADRVWMTQTLTGDSADGYGGCPNVGPKKAEAALAGKLHLSAMWQSVEATYRARKVDPALALLTARLARILRFGDFDKHQQRVRLWAPAGEHPWVSIRPSSAEAPAPA